ncbi:MAG: 1-deoxy-D-xylulose-5-phosphate reductoisomerase, partial [Chloroflexi bacterium]|nr:1-deoxy-D-xylulose-5-phosphate reductoisomerase [Chloroflexota bacterium]
MAKSPLRLAVLGSTGSLGQTVLAVTRAFGEQVRIVGLAAGGNVNLLAQQVQEHRPQMASFVRGQWPSQFSAVLGLRFVSPREMVASPEVDMVVVATAGRASLYQTWAALEAGKRVALGNMDILLMAGPLLKRLAEERRADIYPLDDEPAGVWQCLWGEESPPEQVTITSTWGTLRARRLRQHGPHASVRPSRRIGQKRGIDAATLMTKATQVAAVHYLYGVPLERIQVLFHPESLV